MNEDVSRRRFMRTAVTSAAGVAASASLPVEIVAQDTGMPNRQLGKTGLYVSLIGFGGGVRFWEEVGGPDQADELIQAAIKLGVNFFDTAHGYGDNQEGEKYFGQSLEKHRKKVYIATKSQQRDYDGMMREVEQSLENLRTTSIDVMQIHGLKEDEEIDQIQAEKGCLKAIHKLIEEGTVKHWGITGHSGAKILLKGIRLLSPDTVCFPTNAREVLGYQDLLLRHASSQGIGVIGMKSTGQRRLMAKARAGDLVHYAISLPLSTVLIGIDTMRTLEDCAELAVARRPMSLKEQEFLRDRVASAGLDRRLPYLSPNYHDGVFT